MSSKKGCRGRRAVALAVAAWVAYPLVANGGILVQWDPNPADGLQGGNGVWNTSAANWDAAGTRRAWNNSLGDTAVFGGAAGGTITPGSSALTAAALQIDTAGYTIGATTSPVLNLSSGSITANADAVLAMPIVTTVPLVKSGAGTLTLLGANTIRTSVTINAGLVSFSVENSLGAATNRIDLNGGGLRYAGAAPRTLTSTHTVNVGAAGGTIDTATSLTIAADHQITGTGDLAKAGAQTLTIAGANPEFTGTVTVRAGTLNLIKPGAINGAAVTMSGGTLVLKASASTDWAASLTAAAGDATVTGDGVTGAAHGVGDITVNSGATLTLTAVSAQTVSAHDVNVAGGLRISDSGVAMGGSLGGGGTIFFGPRGQQAAGGPDGLVLTGGGNLAAPTAITADANGRATIGLTNGTALAYDGVWTGNATGAQNGVNLAGGATFAVGASAQLNTLAVDGATARSFVVAGTGVGDTFDLGAGFVADRGGASTFAGLASLDVRGATLVTRSTAALPIVTRLDGAGGTHHAGAIGFSGTTAAAWNVADTAQQYDGGVTVDAPLTLRTDADLTHAGLATGRFDAQFQLPTPGTILTKTGPGVLRLAGSQGYAPGTTIQANDGTLRFDTDPAAGWYAGHYTRGADGAATAAPVAARTLAVIVGSAPAAPGAGGAIGLIAYGATAQFAAPLAGLASLTVNAGGTARLAGDSPASGETLVVDALTVVPSGVVDVASGRLVIDYAAGAASPFNDVAQMAADGRLAGNASPPGERPTAVGYAEASEVFRNIPIASRAFGNATAIDDTAVLVRVTYVGDADLDGRVDFADYQRFQIGYGQAAARWSLGDFNCDGLVNTADFLLFYRNLDPGSVTASQQEALDAFAASVPEPGCALWLTGALLIAGRRRRRGRD